MTELNEEHFYSLPFDTLKKSVLASIALLDKLEPIDNAINEAKKNNKLEAMYEGVLAPVTYLEQLQQNILSNLDKYNIIATLGNEVLQKRTREIQEAIKAVVAGSLGPVLASATENEKRSGLKKYMKDEIIESIIASAQQKAEQKRKERETKIVEDLKALPSEELYIMKEELENAINEYIEQSRNLTGLRTLKSATEQEKKKLADVLKYLHSHGSSYEYDSIKLNYIMQILKQRDITGESLIESLPDVSTIPDTELRKLMYKLRYRLDKYYWLESDVKDIQKKAPSTQTAEEKKTVDTFSAMKPQMEKNRKIYDQLIAESQKRGHSEAVIAPEVAPEVIAQKAQTISPKPVPEAEIKKPEPPASAPKKLTQEQLAQCNKIEETLKNILKLFPWMDTH